MHQLTPLSWSSQLRSCLATPQLWLGIMQLLFMGFPEGEGVPKTWKPHGLEQQLSSCVARLQETCVVMSSQDKMMVILNMFCNEIIPSKYLRNKVHSLLSNPPINIVLAKYFNVSTIRAPPCTCTITIIWPLVNIKMWYNCFKEVSIYCICPKLNYKETKITT
jgi:hypothetical protein